MSDVRSELSPSVIAARMKSAGRFSVRECLSTQNDPVMIAPFIENTEYFGFVLPNQEALYIL
jgi:hypothetical protein